MSKNRPLYFSLDVIVFPLIFVFIAWLVFWAEIRFKLNLNSFGIIPKKVEGLKGILFSPFIHGSLKHLFNNSIPLLVLGSALFYFYRNIKWKVLFIGFVLTGVLTWIIGRPAMHIGGSGIVYFLASFLFFKGIFSKQYQLTALALAVVFIYGSLLWYIFPIDPAISWEGHLSGFVVGIVLAIVFKRNPIEKPKFDWEAPDFNPEEDAFLKHFDENGNFIEQLPEEENLEENKDAGVLDKNEDKHSQPRIIYTIKRNKQQD